MSSFTSNSVHVVGSLHYQAFDKRLEGKGMNAYSQFGEDGLIQAVFELIGEESRWCFEIGAADGVFYSNTLRLRELGWSAVLIEAGDSQFESLQQHARENVFCVHEEATDLDRVLSRFDCPANPDLGVIDIDGQDYWLWSDMQLYQPRVMLVEFHWHNGDDYIPQRGSGYRDQAGEAAVADLGRQKGYIAVAKTHVNLLFVREDVWHSN